MAHVVVLGAGLGGCIQAFELRETMGRGHRITVISDKPYFQFTPSNPWAGVGWRKKDDIIIDLAPVMKPAYEFAMIMDTDLRRRKIRHKVPMTFVTSEPFIGHLGLGGVGDTKGMLESLLRDRHIDWITNAKVEKFADGKAFITEVDEDGKEKKQHEKDFRFAMMLPAFRGIPALRDIEGLVNPRGFVIVDEYQRNPKYPNVFAIGVCIAIAPPVATPVPTGVPKTGFMIESMVTWSQACPSSTAHKAPSEHSEGALLRVSGKPLAR